MEAKSVTVHFSFGSKITKSAAGKHLQAQAAEQGQTFVTAKVQAAMAKNPQMTAKQIQQVSAQAEQEFQSQSVKQILKQVK